MAPEELRDALYELRISQRELAALVNVTPRAISLWLANKRAIPGTVVGYIRVFKMLAGSERQREYDRARSILKGGK